VDSRAGGYTWTAVDGSLAIAAAEERRDAEAGLRTRRGRIHLDKTAGVRHDRPGQDLRFELEDVLADIVGDIARAWR
jgi:hypothetical protein